MKNALQATGKEVWRLIHEEHTSMKKVASALGYRRAGLRTACAGALTKRHRIQQIGGERATTPSKREALEPL
jgi:hypothetical protein